MSGHIGARFAPYEHEYSLGKADIACKPHYYLGETYIKGGHIGASFATLWLPVYLVM